MNESGQKFSERENLVYAAQLLGRNTPARDVEAALVARGVGPITANQMVEQLILQRAKVHRSAGIRGILVGLILVGIGLFVLLTPMGAQSSSSRIIAIAACLYGLARAVQGGLQLLKKS